MRNIPPKETCNRICNRAWIVTRFEAKPSKWLASKCRSNNCSDSLQMPMQYPSAMQNHSKCTKLPNMLTSVLYMPREKGKSKRTKSVFSLNNKNLNTWKRNSKFLPIGRVIVNHSMLRWLDSKSKPSEGPVEPTLNRLCRSWQYVQ